MASPRAASGEQLGIPGPLRLAGGAPGPRLGRAGDCQLRVCTGLPCAEPPTHTPAPRVGAGTLLRSVGPRGSCLVSQLPCHVTVRGEPGRGWWLRPPPPNGPQPEGRGWDPCTTAVGVQKLATFRASILGRAASNLRVTRAVPSLLRGAAPHLDVMPWNRGPDLGAPSPDRPPGPIWGRPFMHLGHLCPSPTGTSEHLLCCGPRASRAPCCRPGLRPQLPGLRPQLPGHL